MRRLCTKKDVPAEAAWDLAKEKYKLKNSDRATLYPLVEGRVECRHPLQRDQRSANS